MRVLHVVKTTDGAQWAADQVAELVRHGIEVHVALPRTAGRTMEAWHESGARLHPIEIGLMSAFSRIGALRRLVDDVAPALIHSHFFNTTLALRYALGRQHAVPRLFQVPGPAHMEYALFRQWDLASAGPRDAWIASSRYTMGLYARAGIGAERLFLSYYGNRHRPLPETAPGLRARHGIDAGALVVGNVNYMYPPRLWLGQTKGIKRHEDVIDALAQVVRQRRDVFGLIVGGQWGGGRGYEARLGRRAARAGQGRIIMTGRLDAACARSAWLDFDLAVHVPVSENCGGVIEPLMAGVPVIAARTGGLPEIVFEGNTGSLVEAGHPDALAEAILAVLEDLPRHKALAGRGRQLVGRMFDVRRTAAEIAAIYEKLLNPAAPTPRPFDPQECLVEQKPPCNAATPSSSSC